VHESRKMIYLPASNGEGVVMKNKTLTRSMFGLAIVLLASATCVNTHADQPPKPPSPTLKERIAQQNALFAEQHAADAAAAPEDATALGDYSHNSELNAGSLASAEADSSLDQSFRARLLAISPEDFPDQDRLSREAMLEELDQRIADYQLKVYEMPVSQAGGIHLRLAELPQIAPFDSIGHVEDYIARLEKIPRAMDETIATLRQGEHDGLTPPHVLLENVPRQCDQIVANDPFLEPIHHLGKGISPQQRLRLQSELASVVKKQVLPAYRRFSAFMTTDYLPHARMSVGESGLPDGQRRYQNEIRRQTTTTMTAAQIHELGLREVDRINALLTDIAHRAGYPDLKAYRAALHADPKYTAKSADQIVGDFRHYIEQMRTHLPELFYKVPDTWVIVQAIPPSDTGPNISHYAPGSADGKQPGKLYVATSDFAHRSLLSDETIAYHEGLPGHELQMAIQQRLAGVPAFRREMVNNAYVEGWAVYAEALGKEVGFFSDPASDYGRLNTELMRAVRLVADTGLNADGWSVAQTTAFLKASGAYDDPSIPGEIDRYIRWPAQGLGYKIGQLNILALRQRAQQELGARFDLRAFHQEILRNGSLPLDVLDEETGRWLQSQLATRELSMAR
jgi:uncharacterized protein (DUF885 family)